MRRTGRKRAKAVTLPELAVKFGASKERVRQAGGLFVPVYESGKVQAVAVRAVDHPLDRLLNNKHKSIDRLQYEAGVKYYSDYYFSGLEPSLSRDYERPVVDVSGNKGPPEFRQDALDRFKEATKTLGPITQPIVDHVCLEGKSLESLEDHPILRREKRYKVAQGLALLVNGLDQLAHHYKLKTHKKTRRQILGFSK